MKILLSISLLLLLAAGCRKELQPVDGVSKIRTALLHCLSPVLFSQLNFDSSFRSIQGPETYWRVGYTGKPLANEFVLLRMADNGDIQSGRLISIAGQIDSGHYNGMISIRTFDETMLVNQQKILNGYIQWENKPISLRDMIVPAAEGKVLPEVIVISQKSTPKVPYMSYYSLESFFGGGGGNISGYYSSAGGGSSSGSTSTSAEGGTKSNPGSGKTGSTRDADVILVDFEMVESKKAIDLEKYIKCFDLLPDGGATCTIEIFADIPVDNDPNKLFEWKSGSPGHTFLQLKKKSGSQTVMQNIGFYPATEYKSILTPAPVNGKFVDNSGHEFNASLLMNVSPENLRYMLNDMLNLSKFVKYDIDEYNCTDFALEIFNYRRQNKIVIEKIAVPGAQAPAGSSCPQMLYLKLKDMKAKNDPEAANINCNIVKGYVGQGKGACN